MVEMTLPGSVFTTSAAAIINSLPQVPVPLTSSATSQGSYQLTVNLPTVPVASMQNQTQQIQVQCRYRRSAANRLIGEVVQSLLLVESGYYRFHI